MQCCTEKGANAKVMGICSRCFFACAKNPICEPPRRDCKRDEFLQCIGEGFAVFPFAEQEVDESRDGAAVCRKPVA